MGFFNFLKTAENDVGKGFNFLKNNVVTPTVNNAKNAVDVVNAERQGVQGLAQVGVAKATGNRQAAQNATVATNKATNYSLNASRGAYTPQEASSKDFKLSFLKPVAKNVVTYAPYALGGAGAAESALAPTVAGKAVGLVLNTGLNFGVNTALNAGGQAVQGKPIDAKAALKGAIAPTIAGAALGALPIAAGLAKDHPLNEVGSVPVPGGPLSKLAKTNDVNEVKKILQGHTDQATIDRIASSIAETSNPQTIKNIIRGSSDIPKEIPPPAYPNPKDVESSIQRQVALDPNPPSLSDIKPPETPPTPVEPPTSPAGQGTIGRLYTPEVEKVLQGVKTSNQAASQAKGVLDEIKSKFTPGGGAEGKAIGNDLRATTGDLALKKNQETIAATPDIKLFSKLTPADHAQFIQKVESGVQQATPELQAQADKFRTAQEADFKIGQELKPDIVHVENYFPRAGFWDNTKGQVDAFLNKWQSPSLGGSPAALEHRAIPTIYDGIKAGLVPKETNPAIIALNSRTQLLRAKAAQDFVETQVKAGHDPTLVQDYVNRVLDDGLSQSPTYKTIKDATYAVNNLQLGFSGFHVASTGINAVVSQFSNGLQDLAHGNIIKGVKDIAKAPIAPVDYIFKGNRIVKNYKNGDITADIKNIAEGGGRIGSQVDYRTTGLSKSLEQLKSGSLKEAGKGIATAPFRAFSTAAKPVMEWWVPRIKAGATKELIDRKVAELGPNASQEALRAAKAAAVDSVDNRFGQLVKDNLYWDKTIKDGATLLTRSPGWNLGTIREIGGGISDLATKTAKGQGLSERTTYTASLAATTMLIGTAMSYMFTGKPPQDAIDYFYPKTGKIDKNGNEERVSLPTYAKDIFSFAHNPAQTLGNKSNPLFSIAKDVATNKDYYGNQVRNPADSAGTQAKQTGSFLAKNLLPFSITSGNQRVEKTPNTKAQSFFGLTPAPGYITKSKFEQDVQSALNTALGTKSLTPEEQKLISDKSAAKQAYKTGDGSKIQELVQSGDLTKKQAKDLQKSTANSSVANQFAYLLKVDRPAAAKIIQSASPEDLQKLGDIQKLIRIMTISSHNPDAKPETRAAAKQLVEYLKKVSNPKGN